MNLYVPPLDLLVGAGALIGVLILAWSHHVSYLRRKIARLEEDLSVANVCLERSRAATRGLSGKLAVSREQEFRAVCRRNARGRAREQGRFAVKPTREKA